MAANQPKRLRASVGTVHPTLMRQDRKEWKI